MNNYSSSSYNVENIAKFKGTYAYRVPVNTDFDEINIMTNDILKNAEYLIIQLILILMYMI